MTIGMWALPILIGVLLAPESPWWLVRHGKYDKARVSLLRLTRRGYHYNTEDAIMLMKRTNEVEEYLSAGAGYLDCFKGVNLRRTEIACMVWMIQTLCGSPMTGYATYFYVQAGFNPERAFDLSLGMYGMAIVGGMISWFLLPSVGRRTLYLWGTGLMCFILVAGGIVGSQHDSTWVSWTLGSVVILFTFVYDTTVGPVCYSLVAELPSTRLRVKTVVLARVAYNLAGIIANVLMPKMLNPTAWNWRGKTCFLWAGTCFCCYIWCYFRLPEPKGLTYLELDLLFEKKVSARKFRGITNILSEAGYFDILAANKGLQDFRGVPSYG
jgi:SP family general alpha glucoside:H+ symporter-like MFS transporter